MATSAAAGSEAEDAQFLQLVIEIRIGRGDQRRMRAADAMRGRPPFIACERHETS